MTNWRYVIGKIATNVEDHFDHLRQRLHERLGRDPIQIVPYRSYGSNQRVVLRGRVLEATGELSGQDNETVWENLLEMYRRFNSHEVPEATVRARLGDVVHEGRADEEGYFRLELTPDAPFDAQQVWQKIELELVAPQSPDGAVSAQIEAIVPVEGVQFGIISDIDDTVVQTGATNKLKMARTVFLGNVRTRLPFPGVAALYQALYSGAPGPFINPIFYVSSSPWNIYDMLADFFDLQGIPQGPMFLRDWGLDEETLTGNRHHRHKLATIQEIMEMYPDLPFLLIGDSGQQDPEIYREVVRRYPNRILAIYIRSIDLHESRIAAVQKLAEEVAEAGSTLVIAEDTLAAARHAAEQGWITAESLAAVEGGKEADLVAPTGDELVATAPAVVLDKADVQTGVVEEALEQQADPKTKAPPIVVEGDGQ